MDDPKYGCASSKCTPCSLPNTKTAKCSPRGECVVDTCQPGFSDCNDRADDGCEGDLLSPATCGDCKKACPTSLPLCSAGACVLSCRAGETQCGNSCVDTSTSALHCGGCNKACPGAPNADGICKGGACTIACRDGFADCDSNLNNGCEPLTVFYEDLDRDGWGVTAKAASACVRPPGFADRGGDCADDDPNVFPGQTAYFGRGYTKAGGAISYDYNCDGVETELSGFVHWSGSCPPPSGQSCSGGGYTPEQRSGAGVDPYCGSTVGQTCVYASGSASGPGGAAASDGDCYPAPASSLPPVLCH
jgi:hypothetical protein